MIHDPVGLGMVLSRIGDRLGIDRSSGDWDAVTVARICTFAQERLRWVWQDEFWPWGVCEVQRRQYAADWAAGTTYAAGAVVYVPQVGYFVSQAGANAGHDPEDDNGDWWLTVGVHEELNPDFVFLRAVDYAQAWELLVWEAVQGVWAMDPRRRREADDLAYDLYDHGLVVVDAFQPDQVWCRLRRAVPVWSTDVLWSSAVAYAAGAVVFDVGTQHCYVALDAVAAGTALSNGAYWEAQVIPRALAPVVIQAAYADELGAGDGQFEKGMAERRVAVAMLEDLADRTFGGQGEIFRAVFETGN